MLKPSPSVPQNVVDTETGPSKGTELQWGSHHPISRMNGVLVRRGDEDPGETPRMHAHGGKAIWGGTEKVTTCKPKRGLKRIKPEDTLILDLQPPELWENKFQLFKPPSWRYFVTTDLANWYTDPCHKDKKWKQPKCLPTGNWTLSNWVQGNCSPRILPFRVPQIRESRFTSWSTEHTLFPFGLALRVWESQSTSDQSTGGMVVPTNCHCLRKQMLCYLKKQNCLLANIQWALSLSVVHFLHLILAEVSYMSRSGKEDEKQDPVCRWSDFKACAGVELILISFLSLLPLMNVSL